MKYLCSLFITLFLFTSCKRLQKDDTVYLAFRNSSTNEILFTEEIEVEQSKSRFMIIKAGSNGSVSYLEKEKGVYQGEMEIFRWNTAFIECEVRLERKAMGRILMKGEFTGVSKAWINGQFTGTETPISGKLELLD
ncbi:MAG: hypothetical protein ACPGU5_00725 [Lishizhenia sp.]